MNRKSKNFSSNIQETEDDSRREFLKKGTILATLASASPLLGYSEIFGEEKPQEKRSVPKSTSRSRRSAKMYGIQVGPDSLVDEGTEKLLDILQEKGAINTIFLTTFTHGQGLAGRQTEALQSQSLLRG